MFFEVFGFGLTLVIPKIKLSSSDNGESLSGALTNAINYAIMEELLGK